MGRSGDRIVRRLIREEMVLTTKQGQTWRGVVLEVDERSVLLAQAESVNRDGTSLPADGQVVIPRADVAYIQKT